MLKCCGCQTNFILPLGGSFLFSKNFLPTPSLTGGLVMPIRRTITILEYIVICSSIVPNSIYKLCPTLMIHIYIYSNHSSSLWIKHKVNDSRLVLIKIMINNIYYIFISRYPSTIIIIFVGIITDTLSTVN